MCNELIAALIVVVLLVVINFKYWVPVYKYSLTINLVRFICFWAGGLASMITYVIGLTNLFGHEVWIPYWSMNILFGLFALVTFGYKNIIRLYYQETKKFLESKGLEITEEQLSTLPKFFTDALKG